jgi:hypothetical protein
VQRKRSIQDDRWRYKACDHAKIPGLVSESMTACLQISETTFLPLSETALHQPLY